MAIRVRHDPADPPDHLSLLLPRRRFLIVGAFCGAWAIVLLLFLPNSPTSFRGFTPDERLMMIARLRKNQTGIEQRKFKSDQAMEWLTDYKTVRSRGREFGLTRS